jgi:Anti-sigma-K factor rskA
VTDDDDRISYLTGESGIPLDPDERAALDDLRQLLADPAVWDQPAADLEDRVVHAISAEAGAAGPVPTSANQAQSKGRARRRVMTIIAGLAAAVVIAVGLAVSLVSGGPQPETLRAALAGTDLAPSASGEATMTKTSSGWRINLQAHGLPLLNDGRYYEAWLKDPAGELVPVGTFNQPENVTLWAGVAPTQYSTLTVTEQLANGDPASSGQRVLLGTAHPGG